MVNACKFVLALVLLCLLAHITRQSFRLVERLGDFKVYWNVPTFQCRSHKIHFDELVGKLGIVQNKDDAFKGERVTILYDPGDFPAILNDDNNVEPFLRNGGVPQAGNLSDHLLHFEERVLADIPDENYDGVAIIDFESWRPIFRQNWGTLLPYKTLSVEIERRRHPGWSDKRLVDEATRRFERAGLHFMDETLALARNLRPNGTWGYYAYPYCFNMVVGNMEPSCSSEVMAENDRILSLFGNSDALYPSLYLPQNRLNASQRVEMIEGRILESQRINGKLRNAKRILPYFWYVYQDSKNFLSKEDLRNSFVVLKSLGIDGVVIWGSSNDVNTKEKCRKLYTYIDKVLGPIVNST